jgi:hypothetical protein
MSTVKVKVRATVNVRVEVKVWVIDDYALIGLM